MKTILKHTGVAIALAGLSAGATYAQAKTNSIDGRWDAALVRPNGETVPFRLDISGDGNSVKGTFYNGFKPFDSTTSGSFQNGELTLRIDHYLTSIHAKLNGDQLAGDVATLNRASTGAYAFKAVRHADVKDTASNAPQIAGDYIIPLETPSAKGEKAFHFVVEQRGPEVAATILRVDGDTGAFTGTFHDGKFRLSHFDGSRPGVIEVTPQADGTLVVEQNPGSKPAAAAETKTATTKAYGEEPPVDSRYTPKLVAYKESVALAKGLPQPENYSTHTTVRDPNEAFKFNFPDVNGKLVSSDDPRFKGKVVVAVVTGTWCPNCHDEAQYLVQLDKKYRDKGLAIVALDFEEPEQQASLEREKAFVKQYGVDYTYLIAGAPAEMWEKVPQAVNLNTWPATLFVGRDGRVKSVHSGFASPASGKFNDELKAEFTAQIEKLLAENQTQTASLGIHVEHEGGQ
ncbi:MAG: TlpA disulfide reductase family protein [Terriglobus sp.]